MKLIPIPKDGNCLFGAVSKGLQLLQHKPKPQSALEMRAEVVQHLQKNKAKYLPEWDNEMPDRTVAKSYEAYLEAIAQDRVWGGLLEIQALSRMHGTKIIVYPTSFDLEPFVIHPKQRKKIIVLQFTGSHFDLLVPSEDGGTMPRAFVELETPPPHVPVRGGGHSPQPTEWTSDLDSQVSWRTGPTAGSHQQDLSLNEHALPRAQAAPCNKASLRTSVFARAGGFESWCEYCPWRASAKSATHAGTLRRQHIEYHHPEAKRPSLRRKRQCAIEIDLPDDIPKAWSCAYCKACIRAQEHTKREHWQDLVIAHRKEKHPSIPVATWTRKHRQSRLDHGGRMQCRARELNRSVAASTKLDLTRWEPFMWPKCTSRHAAKRGLVFKFNIARAWACKECKRCFRRAADAAKHRCKDPKARPKHLLANLKKEKRTALQWSRTKPDVMQGFTARQIETLFDNAIDRAETAAALMYHRS